MDKGKYFNKPSSKGKTPGFAGDFIALGSKAGPSSSRSSTVDSAPNSDSKRAASNVPSSAKPLSFPGSSSSKRDLSASQASAPAGPKKFKDFKGLPIPKPSSSATVPKLVPEKKSDPSSTRAEAWEEFATEVEFSELTTNLVEAEEADDEERIEALLCGAVRQLKAQRSKIDPTLVLTLLYTAKSRPNFFFTEYIVEALSSLLKREATPAPGMKIRANGTVLAVLGANLLMAAYQEEKTWPEAFLKAYVEDALGERVWVDREDCQGFVSNILTAFGTRLPPRHMFSDSNVSANTSLTRPEPSSSPSLSASLTGAADEDMDTDSVVQKTANMQADVPVFPRYTTMQESAEQFVLDVIKEQMARRQQPDSATRNLLKFLAATCGIAEVRLMSAQKLEVWLMNPKITRAAHELFLSICLNCSNSAVDTEIIAALIKVRSKTKPAINIYLNCFKELVEAFPDHLYTVMKHTIYNELSTTRNPNNMALLTVLFQHWAEKAPSVMADVFMELLLNREDFLRALRALLREIVRSLRFEINLHYFCVGLLRQRDVPDSPQTAHLNSQVLHDFEFKDRLLLSMADLVTLAIFLGITPAIREAATRADTRMAESLKNYQLQVATIQRDAVSWLFLIVPKLFRPSKTDFTHCLHKVLLMEQPEQYWNKDGWPPDVDRSIFLRLAAEVPVLDDTLYQILRMGLSKDHPILPADAVELGDYLLRRAAALLHSGYPVLQTDKLHFIDVLFNLSAYHHPESISLPQDYVPPKLAIAHLYWKAWSMLLVLTAHNPTVYGELVWNSYPTLRALMEMCITNQFVFPPATFASSGKSDLKLQEQQISALEKQTILEFESHLAAASSKVPITEANSLLLSQLTSLDPLGPARKPGQVVLDQLRTLNSSLKLGHLLCRSRQPDFLLDIIQRQGPEQSMPWLADLVESSDNAYCMLPVQCLCEFLLRQMVDDVPITDLDDSSISAVKVSKKREKKQKQQVLLQYLRSLLLDAQQDEQTPREILDYFLRRLSSPNRIGRYQAIKVLQLLLNPVCGEKDKETKEETAFQWLITGLPTLPHFGSLHHTIVQALRQSLQVESSTEAVAAYLKYLAMYTTEDSIQELSEMALDLAQLIVERSSLMASLLPLPSMVQLPLSSTYIDAFQALLNLFGTYMCKIRQMHKEAYSWSENQDQIFIQWPTGETATMHILVVHAIIILLTSGPIPPSPESEVQATAAMYQDLLEMWFSERHGPPSAYLVDTSEEALLFPDWLKLRMIRSSVPGLVDAALKDLEPAQLILFIQSFGIPVASISKLLRTLDVAVKANPFAFVEVDMDKAYMAQLLNIQWSRGAQEGHDFADIMQLEEPPLPSPSVSSIDSSSTSKLPLPITVVHGRSNVLQADQAESVLKRLFDMGTVIRLSHQEKQEILRTLLKALSVEMSQKTSNKPLVSAVSSSLVHLATSGPESGTFLASLDRQPNFSSAILRLLTTFAKRQEEEELKNNLQLFFSVLDNSPIIRQPVLKQLTTSYLKKPPVGKTTGAGEARLVQLTGEALLTWKIPNECSPRAIFDKLISPKDQATAQGLNVDWLQVLDPELQAVEPAKLLQKEEISNDVQKVSSRPYLMSLMTHQTKWSTLWNFISNMLQPQKIGEYDATMALNFLRACTLIPKLWQGRDKHVPKHSKIEVLFRFNKKQLHAMVELMAIEYTQNLQKTDSQYAVRTLRDRLLLLLQCSQSRQQDIQVAQWLYDQTQKNPSIAHAALLTQLYMRRPHVALHLSCPLWQPMEVADLPTEIDTFAHAMLSSLAALQPGRDGHRRLMDLDMAFRKLTATHPSLVVRQLGLLASYLKGRAHFEWNVLKSRNEFAFFSCALGFLEILMPHCFQPQHRPAFLDALDSYFELVKNHGSLRDMADVVRRLHSIVDNALAYDPSMSVSFQKHAQMLSTLAATNADLRNLQVLCSSVTRAVHQKVSHTNAMNWVQAPKGRKANVGPLLLRLRHSDSTEEMEQVLNDLDLATADCPWVLEHVWDDVRAFLTSPAPAVRRLSFVLALRLLHTKPQKASELFPDMLSCLSHIDMAVVSTALEKLPELCLLAQEFAPALFARVFELASEVNVDVVPFLVDAASVLQHQCGV